MTLGSVQILGASFFSTHHASAGDAVAGRDRGVTPPSFDLLVGRARRFTSLVTQMHVEVCGALPIDAAAPPLAVFATCHGEIQTAERLITDFRDTSVVSSARFALSVHNTASGVYSVATASTAASTTVTGANAVAAGWLEAVLTTLDAGRAVLLSIADEPVPDACLGPTDPVGFAAGFLLGPRSSTGRHAELAITPGVADEPFRPLHALARAADAWVRDVPATIALGCVQPGTTLELRLVPEGPTA